MSRPKRIKAAPLDNSGEKLVTEIEDYLRAKGLLKKGKRYNSVALLAGFSLDQSVSADLRVKAAEYVSRYTHVALRPIETACAEAKVTVEITRYSDDGENTISIDGETRHWQVAAPETRAAIEYDQDAPARRIEGPEAAERFALGKGLSETLTLIVEDPDADAHTKLTWLVRALCESQGPRPLRLADFHGTVARFTDEERQAIRRSLEDARKAMEDGVPVVLRDDLQPAK